MTEDPEWGGQGMPSAVALAASEYLVGANCAFMIYQGLTARCRQKSIETFGTESHKRLFLVRSTPGMDRHDVAHGA